MRDIIEDFFCEVIKLLIEKKYIKLQNYFLDGTKIEANANKYTFVWNKTIDNYDRKPDEKIKNHLRETDRIVAEENEICLDDDLSEMGENSRITAEQPETVVESIDRKLSENPDNKVLKKKAKEFKKDILPGKQKYEDALATFKGRNSYSKTDHDATFMRMKEDAMLNGQLKPGYNIQIGTENRYIVGFTIHPNPTDTKTLIPHLNYLEEKPGQLPQNIIADAGYGSEENYEYWEEKNLGSYVKYNRFHWEKKKKNRTIRISHRLNELKRKANENLCSEKKLKLRSQRVVEVEQVFGRIKGCWSFRRFHLRGTDKVKIEWGLPAIAHNITKMALEG